MTTSHEIQAIASAEEWFNSLDPAIPKTSQKFLTSAVLSSSNELSNSPIVPKDVL